MEKTNVDKVVAANFPELSEHMKWIRGLNDIQKRLNNESLICAKKCKPIHAERRELLAEARKSGVDTKSLKQMKKVLDFMEKEVINVHEKIGDDAGDTFAAMADQFSLPFAGMRPGKDLLETAEEKYEAKKKKRLEKEKAEKAAAKADKNADNAKNLKAMGGKKEPAPVKKA